MTELIKANQGCFAIVVVAETIRVVDFSPFVEEEAVCKIFHTWTETIYELKAMYMIDHNGAIIKTWMLVYDR